jgi:hypothetical protein
MKLKMNYVVCVLALGLCLGVKAQDAFNLTDIGTGDIRVFTNSMGTASTNGTMVVFEGQLDSTFNVTSAFNEVSGLYLASLRLLTQIELFDELPTSNEVGDVQGAIAALRVAPASSDGIYFAWGISNAVATWVPLMNTNGTQFAVRDGETNYVTFVFSYPTDASPVTYQVFIGDVLDAEMTPSETLTSPTAETNGITSLSMLGVGGVQEVGSASGSPAPLSASVSLSVYYASNSVCADIYTVSERGTMPIKVYAWINGAWVLVGTVDNVFGEGDHKYHIILTGLTPGQSYQFRVIDEVGREYTLSQPYEVKAITVGDAAIESVVVAEMEMQMLTVTFNTEAGRRYQVKISENLAAPVGQWTVEDVYLDSVGGFVTEFTAGVGTQTQIRIPVNKNKAFFRIYMLED